MTATALSDRTAPAPAAGTAAVHEPARAGWAVTPVVFDGPMTATALSDRTAPAPAAGTAAVHEPARAGWAVTPPVFDEPMTATALSDRTAPALRRAGWAGACGPVVAREHGPGYAAGDTAGGDGGQGPSSAPGGLGALLGATDSEVVGAALADLPAERLARALRAAVGRLDVEDAAAAVTAATRPLTEDAALGVCRSLLGGWSDAGLLSVAEEAVTALGRRTLGVGAVPDTDLHASWERLQRLERRVAGEKLRRLREISERGSCRTQGARSPIDLLVRHGLTYREAREQVDTAAALGELPKTAKALAEGTIGLGQAAEAAKALAEAKKARADAARREADARDQAARDQAEAQAARDAAEAGAEGDQVAGARDEERAAAEARAAAEQAAQARAAEERAAEERAAEERAAAARAADRGEIDEAVAGAGGDVNRRQLRDQLAQEAARRSTDRAADKDRRAYRNRHVRKFRDGDGETLQVHGPAAAVAGIWRMLQALAKAAVGTDDERTPEQARFDAARHVADRYLREGRLPDVAGHPAQVLLIATPAALHDVDGADPCTLDGCGPVSSETARMICCDAQVTVVIIDADGQPLCVGRTRYEPTRAQRRAVTARDRVCIGCGADTTYCEVHHVRWWRHNGPTDIDNLALVCWNCHTHIHHHGWVVWRDPAGGYHTGPPHTRPPDARPVDGGAPGGGGPTPRPPGGPPAGGTPRGGAPDPRQSGRQPGSPPDGSGPGPRPPRVRPPQHHMPDPRPSTARTTRPAGPNAEPCLWETDPPPDEPPPHRRIP